jgi:hypothetical protein
MGASLAVDTGIGAMTNPMADTLGLCDEHGVGSENWQPWEKGAATGPRLGLS